MCRSWYSLGRNMTLLLDVYGNASLVDLWSLRFKGLVNHDMTKQW